jgi:hypothetical protein
MLPLRNAHLLLDYWVYMERCVRKDGSLTWVLSSRLLPRGVGLISLQCLLPGQSRRFMSGVFWSRKGSYPSPVSTLIPGTSVISSRTFSLGRIDCSVFFSWPTLRNGHLDEVVCIRVRGSYPVRAASEAVLVRGLCTCTRTAKLKRPRNLFKMASTRPANRDLLPISRQAIKHYKKINHAHMHVHCIYTHPGFK